jgi:hypothetical protein
MKIGGKKVIDASKPLILYVNKHDIANGQIKNANACAIARAVKRQLEAKSAKVHLSRTYVEYDDKWVRYHTPLSARTELIAFDRGKKFEEGVYKLPPIQPAARLTGKRTGGVDSRKRAARSKGNANARGKHHHIVTGVRATAHKNIWGKARKEA